MERTEAESTMVWRTAGGDGLRRGLGGSAGEIQWRPSHRLTLQAAVQVSPVFDKAGRIFVADMAGHVHAFSPDGAPLWQVKLDGGVSATPAVAGSDQLLFVATQMGRVCAMGTTNGRIEWETVVPTQSDPRILSDLLFWAEQDAVVLSSWGGEFVSLSAISGQIQCAWDAGRNPYASAARDPKGRVYTLRTVSGKGAQLVELQPGGSDRVLHVEETADENLRRLRLMAAPVVDPERSRVVFIVNQPSGGRLLAWSIDESRIAWSCDLPNAVLATPAVQESGRVVLADSGGAVQTVDADGQRLAPYVSGAEYLLAAPVTDRTGRAYVGDPIGVVHVIESPGQGKAVFETSRSIQAQPSFDANGNLYVASTDGTVCIFPRAKEPQG